MFHNNQRRDEWESVEEAMKQYWTKHNTNPNINWNSVKDEVRFGWLMAKELNQTRESIH
ncbi:hypothetical protein HNQ80_004810 [Anaerosolibacter carboniphilus]|uniref:Uncharacterized protein n=1 Tax=Anaerosolibacter carboniphilus TaxID=1417629 RepID=A0A841KY01_9FIRM|nr:hypothetical protein [Anaerosolibacter carboniphilus]MBB6218636.1 hypothetical protein [Anaerosolibacter carboniphilus]